MDELVDSNPAVDLVRGFVLPDSLRARNGSAGLPSHWLCSDGWDEVH